MSAETGRTLDDANERKRLCFEVDGSADRDVFSGIMTVVPCNRVYGTKSGCRLGKRRGGEG